MIERSGGEPDSIAALSVRPTPQADELAAILAALRARRARADTSAPAVSAWVIAARRGQLRGAGPGVRPGGWRLASRLESLR